MYDDCCIVHWFIIFCETVKSESPNEMKTVAGLFRVLTSTTLSMVTKLGKNDSFFNILQLQNWVYTCTGCRFSLPSRAVMILYLRASGLRVTTHYRNWRVLYCSECTTKLLNCLISTRGQSLEDLSSCWDSEACYGVRCHSEQRCIYCCRLHCALAPLAHGGLEIGIESFPELSGHLISRIHHFALRPSFLWMAQPWLQVWLLHRWVLWSSWWFSSHHLIAWMTSPEKEEANCYSTLNDRDHCMGVEHYNLSKESFFHIWTVKHNLLITASTCTSFSNTAAMRLILSFR